LGVGFLEKVYENALAHELQQAGLIAEQQRMINVRYGGVVVGHYFADILVNNTVVVEIKAAQRHENIFTAQCLNYLKATGMPLCLLLNFGQPRLDIRRYRGRSNSSHGSTPMSTI
jgi:GxxExxY protein